MIEASQLMLPLHLCTPQPPVSKRSICASSFIGPGRNNSECTRCSKSRLVYMKQWAKKQVEVQVEFQDWTLPPAPMRVLRMRVHFVTAVRLQVLG